MPLPEGYEIRRTADELAAAIAGQQVTRIFFAFDHLKPYASRLQGETVWLQVSPLNLCNYYQTVISP